MNHMPAQRNGSVKSAEQLEKQKAKEDWHKLVVKILTWKDGSSSDSKERITDSEWKTYYKTIVNTNLTYSKDKVLSNLKEIRATIEENGGFEE